MNAHFRNRAISAAAGTGKTFRLVHRYLGLMAAGVPPERICALTFTRKAAGEIFDKIVARLCEAVVSDEEREVAARMIRSEGAGATGTAAADYIVLLRKLLDSGHRLRIGTLDSFILGIVRAFPMELGIPPDTQPIDGEGGEALAMRLSILSRLYDPTRRAGGVQEFGGAAFLADFRQARGGQETKQLALHLDKIISDGHYFYRRHPPGNWRWGDVDSIWPEAAERWWDRTGAPAKIPADLSQRLTEAFGTTGNSAKLGAALGKIALAASEHGLDKVWPDNLSAAVLPQLFKLAAQDDAVPRIRYNRGEYDIPNDSWPGLRGALGHMIGVEVRRVRDQTRGLATVLEHYDHLRTAVLGTEGGRFTFEDLSSLLGSDGRSPSLSPAAGHPHDNERLYIDYRLDGQLDHWLLDEFQDTSDTQWEALANLVDEVVQDENRSFFYVGDVKQSIYGWRGGNHRLFHSIRDKYRGLGERAIGLESIAECYRSLPAVVETVNAVFDNLEAWVPAAGADGPRKAAVEAFAAFWERHVSARRNAGEGFAALWEYEPGKKTPADDEDEAGDEMLEGPVYQAIAGILADACPVDRGLSVAVLVRSNPEGRACVDALRRLLPGVPVVHEGSGGIVDHPVVTALLALVRFAAHPGDTVALRHLQMSPLSANGVLDDTAGLPAVILRSLHDNGFGGTLRDWGGRLGTLDDFGNQRLRELLLAAEAFDASGGRDPDAFADHIVAHRVKASAAAGTVRVMTIHQAKGLGFDLVIVPFAANARSFASPGSQEMLAGDDWVLKSPSGVVTEAAGGAPCTAREAAAADANFAQLCTLYVALTRAARALHMVIPARGKTSKTVREADLLRDRLSSDEKEGGDSGTEKGSASTKGMAVDARCLYTCGDADWYRHTGQSAPSRAEVKLAPPMPPAITYGSIIGRIEPSKAQESLHEYPAKWLFSSEAGDVRAFGASIHRLFEKIEWLEETDVDAVVAAWREESSERAELLDDVERQFRRCLSSEAIRLRLGRPVEASRAEVWREAPFDLMLAEPRGPVLISGRFDRVVVERDQAGRALRAKILDFKSNRVDDETSMRKVAEGYAFQMSQYVRAAASLLCLPPASVTALLLFTRGGRIYPE